VGAARRCWPHPGEISMTFDAGQLPDSNSWAARNIRSIEANERRGQAPSQPRSPSTRKASPRRLSAPAREIRDVWKSGEVTTPSPLTKPTVDPLPCKAKAPGKEISGTDLDGIRGVAPTPEPSASPRTRAGSVRNSKRRVSARSLELGPATPVQTVSADQPGRVPTPAEWVQASRSAQGLPPVVTDPLVLRNVQTIMRAGLEDKLAPVLQLKPRRQPAARPSTTPPPDEIQHRDVAL